MEHSTTLDTATPSPAEPIATHQVRGGGGLSLHVREWGDPKGRAVLLIHGWSQSQMCWEGQTSGPLAERCHLVSFDLRGHGMSEAPLDAARYVDARLWADDVAAVIEQTHLDRPVVVGWSYGGLVITDYLRTYGEQAIAGIELVGAAVMMHPPRFDHIGPGLLDNAADACAPDLATNIAAVQRFLDACSTRPLGPEHRSRALCWNMVVPREVRAALLSRESDADDVLSSLSVPVLVTHGRDDTIVLPSMAEHVLDVCDTAAASWYDGVGHMPFVEDRVRFDRELAEFVDRAAMRTRP